MEQANCVVEIKNLWTRFGKHLVHRDINLCVHPDEVLAIVGGSGSGKTALLRQMFGLGRPTRGTVNVFGQPLYQSKAKQFTDLRTRWGVLFQQGALFSALNVFDNIALPLRELRVLSEGMISDLVMLKLKMVQIEPENATKMPAELSGGMIKRVGLARALALEPELLFLDEPTAGLDPDRSESFVKLIENLRRELCLTVVMVTHDLDTLLALADRVAVLADQKLIAVGKLDEVMSDNHPFIRNFFRSRVKVAVPSET